MGKIAAFAGILTIALCYAFLYCGSIDPLFHTTLLSRIFGLVFELSLLTATALFIVRFRKENRLYFYFTLTVLGLFLLHLLFIITVGYQKQYSYAMDVGISVLYLLILSKNWERLVQKH